MLKEIKIIKIIYSFIATIFIATISFLLFAFYNCAFNIQDWGDASRGLCSFFLGTEFILWIASVVCIYFINDN